VPPEELVLDCACGIGTQALGLVSHGWSVIGSDLSPTATSRARTEATGRDVRLPVAVADMCALPFTDAGLAALVCADNALPHLTTSGDLAVALAEFRRVLRPGGVALISTRDYDRARQDLPTSSPPGVHESRQGGRSHSSCGTGTTTARGTTSNTSSWWRRRMGPGA